METIARERGLRVLSKYADIELSDLDGIELVLFVVDDEHDINRAMRSCRRDVVLIIECESYRDKRRKAELTINFLDINIHDRKYKYNKVNQQILLIT